MSADRHDGIEPVISSLLADLGAHWNPAYVRDVIEQARADLNGQILPSALPEMLDRLVRHRLAAFDDTTDVAS